jgi:hypothetical protein
MNISIAGRKAEAGTTMVSDGSLGTGPVEENPGATKHGANTPAMRPRFDGLAITDKSKKLRVTG